MPIEQIVVLALIQGITEFLPISSSGHLILVPLVTGWTDQGVMTDVMVHMGSFVAVVVYFWRDILRMIVGFFALRAGLIPVIQAALVGSILGNSLFVLGLAFFVALLDFAPPAAS